MDWALCRDCYTPEVQHVHYIEWNREVGSLYTLNKEMGLVHADKQGGRVYAIQVDQGYRFS